MFGVLSYRALEDDAHFADKSPMGWELRASQPSPHDNSAPLCRVYSIPSYGDVISSMYFILDRDPYEETSEIAFELNGVVMWRISGPGLKLLHCLGTAAERDRRAMAAKNGILDIPFRSAFSISIPFGRRFIRLTTRSE